MPAATTPRSGRRMRVWMGASAATLKPYVLAPNTTSPYQRTPVSEYAAPIRLGPPDYDARLIASTISLPDFAGGLGRYLPDSRQEPNRSWFSTCDTRQQGVIALLPKFTAAGVTTQPNNDNGAASFVFSDVNSTNRLYMANGQRLYSTTGTAWTDVIARTAGDYTFRLRSIFQAGIDYLVWLRASSAHGDASEFASLDPGTALSWNALPPTDTLTVDIAHDPIDATVIVLMGDSGIISTRVSSPNNTAGDVTVGNIGRAGHFLGVMQGILFMVDGKGKLWDYDPTRLTGEQLRLQTDVLPEVRAGVAYQNAQLALTDGRRVVFWAPNRPSREITPGAPDGFPASIRPTIRGLFTLGDRLLAYVSYLSGGMVGLIEYEGGGWHQLSKSDAITGTFQSTIGGGSLANDDLRVLGDSGFGFDPTTQRHWLAYDVAGALTTSYNTLPPNGDVPWTQEILVAGDGFEATGTVETGWHSFGFRGLEGPLIQVRLLQEQPDSTVSVAVSYRLNQDEASGWTALGTLTQTARTLLFAAGQGTAFRTVRFKLELARGASALSPNAGIGIDFLKVPEQLTQRTVLIDWATTAAEQRVSEQQVYDDLLTLAEQKTLPLVRVPGEADAFVKFSAPREQSWISARGRKSGGLIVSAIEVVQ